jgi:hypothetical protein
MVSKNIRVLANRNTAAPQVVSYVSRPGEGVVVEISVLRATVADGVNKMTFSLDLSKAQVPSRRFYANAVQVAQEEGAFHLCFGQKKLFAEAGSRVELRAMLDVVLVSEAMSQFLMALQSHQFNGMTQSSVSSFTEEPAQTIPLNASFAAVSVGAEESCLDFYHSSAFELAAVAAGQRSIHLDPVVRVILPTSLFQALIEDLRMRVPHTAFERTNLEMAL